MFFLLIKIKKVRMIYSPNKIKTGCNIKMTEPTQEQLNINRQQESMQVLKIKYNMIKNIKN